MTHYNVRNVGMLILLGFFSLAFAEDYSLERYIRKVSQDNPDLAIARLKEASAGQSEKLALSSLLPVVAATASYSRNLEDILAPSPAYVIVDGATGTKPVQYVNADQNKDNELSYGIAVKFNIFSAKDIASWKQASKNEDIQADVTELTRQRILTAAKKLYAQVQLAQAVVEVREMAEKNSAEAYRIVERKFTAGAVTELDLRLAEVDWKTDVSLLSEARRNAEVVMMALKSLAGITDETVVALTEKNGELLDRGEAPSLSEVLASRPDYRAQLGGKEIADLGFKSAIGLFLPTVSGGLSLMHGAKGDASSFSDYEYDSVVMQIGVTLPLYTGGARTALIRTAKNQQAQASLQLQKMETEIQENMKAIDLRLNDAMGRVETARAIVAAASRAVELAQSSLSNGLMTQLEFSQANTKLAGARLGLQNAIYEYRAAFYDWELATGKVD